MPVTIGTVTSNVNVVEGGGMTDEMMERIIKLAVTRMKEEMRSQESARQENEIPGRRSESDLF